MTISDLWNSDEYVSKFDSAYSSLMTLPNIAEVHIIMVYKDVTDKNNVSFTLPKFSLLWKILKMTLKSRVRGKILRLRYYFRC